MLMTPASSFALPNGFVAEVLDIEAVSRALAAEWQMLASIATEPNAFAEPWFVLPAASTLAERRTIKLAMVRDEAGYLAGVVPLAIESRYGRIPVSHVANWTHFQCFMGTPLIRRGNERAFWLTILRLLDASDWARGLLTISGLLANGPVHKGLESAAAALGRPCPIVHARTRAALASDDTADAYLAGAIRPKKRKELRRLAKRLGELGNVSFSALSRESEIDAWCDDFLALEASGWKGLAGSAFAKAPNTEDFFRQIILGAHAEKRLDFQRLDLDCRPIAMLVNFRTPPGSWSFKIAYDEQFARFSPGLLIELENLPRVLEDPEVGWMDSCAVEDHPMINSLWQERRTIVQAGVPLSGRRRRALFASCRALERGSAALRALTGRGLG